MPLDGRDHPDSFASAYSFPQRDPIPYRLCFDELDHVAETSLRGIFMGDIALLQQDRAFWNRFHARLQCAENESGVGYPCTFIELAWKIALELDCERALSRIQWWAGRPEGRYYDDPRFILKFTSEFRMLLGHMLEKSPFMMTDGLKERKANSAAALQELQTKFENKKTVDVSSDDEEVQEVIPPHNQFKYRNPTLTVTWR